MNAPSASRSPFAFSLIELLSVLAIVSVLSSLALFSMTSAGRGQHVNVSASNLANTLVQARSEAIARNTPVRLYIVAEDSTDPSLAGRAFMLAARVRGASGTTDLPITKWMRLDSAVSILREGVTLPTSADQNLLKDATMAELQFQGRTIKSAYVEFSPTGGVRAPIATVSHSYILLAPVYGGAGSTIEARSAGVKADEKNWRKIRIGNLTGQIQVESVET